MKMELEVGCAGDWQALQRDSYRKATHYRRKNKRERPLILANVHILETTTGRIRGSGGGLLGGRREEQGPFDIVIRSGVVHAIMPHQPHRETRDDAIRVQCHGMIACPGEVAGGGPQSACSMQQLQHW
jgi:hypothetical protein